MANTLMGKLIILRVTRFGSVCVWKEDCVQSFDLSLRQNSEICFKIAMQLSSFDGRWNAKDSVVVQNVLSN